MDEGLMTFKDVIQIWDSVEEEADNNVPTTAVLLSRKDGNLAEKAKYRRLMKEVYSKQLLEQKIKEDGFCTWDCSEWPCDCGKNGEKY